MQVVTFQTPTGSPERRGTRLGSPLEECSSPLLEQLHAATSADDRTAILDHLLSQLTEQERFHLRDRLRRVPVQLVDPVLALPHEIVIRIFSFLDSISLARTARCCKAWWRILSDNEMWRQMCTRRAWAHRCTVHCQPGQPHRRPSLPLTLEAGTAQHIQTDMDVNMMQEGAEGAETTKLPVHLRRSRLDAIERSIRSTPWQLPAPNEHSCAATKAPPDVHHPWKLSFIDRYLCDINWAAGHYHVTAQRLQDALPLTMGPSAIVSIDLRDGGCQLHEERLDVQQTRKLPTDETGIVFARFTETLPVQLLLGRRDGVVELWDIDTTATRRTARIQAFANCEVATATLFVISTDTLSVLCGAQDGKLVRYDVQSGRLMTAYRSHEEEVAAIVVHKSFITALPSLPLSKRGGEPQYWLLSASVDKSIQVHDVQRGTRLHRIAGAHEAGILCMSLWQGCLLTGAMDGSIKVWDLRSWTLLQTITDAHAGGVVCFTAARQDRLLTGGTDGALKVWRALPLSPLLTAQLPTSFVATSDTTGSSSSSIEDRLHEKEALPRFTFQLAYTVKEHTAPLWCIDVREGFMVTGALDGSIKTWDFHGLRTLGIQHIASA